MQGILESRGGHKPRASRESVMKLADEVGATVTWDRGKVIVIVGNKEYRYKRYMQAYHQLYRYKRRCK